MGKKSKQTWTFKETYSVVVAWVKQFGSHFRLIQDWANRVNALIGLDPGISLWKRGSEVYNGRDKKEPSGDGLKLKVSVGIHNF